MRRSARGRASAAANRTFSPSARETNETCGRKIMRRFVVQFVTGIDFVDGDEASDDVVQNYKRHLAETVQDATQNLALRTIKGVRVEKVQVEEIKTERI
jgi:lactate dehydrogenase-like 2-hydroxyacid dehydrogenase